MLTEQPYVSIALLPAVRVTSIGRRTVLRQLRRAHAGTVATSNACFTTTFHAYAIPAGCGAIARNGQGCAFRCHWSDRIAGCGRGDLVGLDESPNHHCLDCHCHRYPRQPATATPRQPANVTPLPTATPVVGVAGQPTPLGAAALARTSQAQTAQAQAPTQTAQAVEAEVSSLFASSRRVFYDEFVDNRNAWFTGVFQEIELDLIEDGVFKVIWTGRGTSYELYELSAFTNFISEVDCRIARGGGDGSCSLVFSQQRDVGFYKFEFFIDYFRLFIVPAEGELVTLVEGDPRLFTTIGEVNRLRVIKQGDRIRLFINGVVVGDLRDATYPSGRIGVSTTCYREEGGVEVHFDNFGIWSLPDV